MRTVLLGLFLIVCCGVRSAVCAANDCQDDVYVEMKGDIARPRLRNPKKEKTKMDKLRCVSCQEEFSYDSEIAFKLAYDGDENLCVGLGLKIFSETGWRLYDSNYPGFDEGTVVFIPKHAKGAVHKWARKERPGIEKGARFMLFAWKLYPDSRGLIKDIHEFTMKAKAN